MSEGVSVIGEPSSSGAFEAGLKDVTMTGFDQAGAYGQIQTQSAGVIELIAAVELRVRVETFHQPLIRFVYRLFLLHPKLDAVEPLMVPAFSSVLLRSTSLTSKHARRRESPIF